jgi:hypothetical protein
MFSFLSGGSVNIKEYIGFEDIKYAISHSTNFIIINTLSANEQDLLIYGTLPCDREENAINEQISNYRTPDLPVIIYGRNCSDDCVRLKQEQLVKLGVKQVYIYMGGLFEWLLMQDIYGNDEFPTTSKCMDLLKYRSPRRLEKQLLLEHS